MVLFVIRISWPIDRDGRTGNDAAMWWSCLLGGRV